jgi:hypothetical protein
MAWSWNGNDFGPAGNTREFAEQAGDIGNCRMFADACNERAAVIGYGAGVTPWVGPILYPERGSEQSIKAFWNGILNFALQAGQVFNFVRQGIDIGGGYQIPNLMDYLRYNAATIPQPTPQPYDANAAAGYIYDSFPINFPPFDVVRYYPRTISSLTAPGQAGQRARFEATISQNRRYSGRYYDHVGGTWVQSPDQTADPDALEKSAFPSGGIFPARTIRPQQDYPFGGDYFDGRFIRYLRDILNLMTRTLAASSNVGISQVKPIATLGRNCGEGWDTSYRRWGYGTTEDEAINGGAYHDVPNIQPHGYNEEEVIGNGAISASVSHHRINLVAPWDHEYRVERQKSQVGNQTVLHNPLEQQRKIELYGFLNVGFGGTVQNPRFCQDTFGDLPNVRAQWMKLWETQTSNSAPGSVMSPMFGGGDMPAPFPPAVSPDDGSPCNYSRAYQITHTVFIIDHNIGGGFQYGPQGA